MLQGQAGVESSLCLSTLTSVSFSVLFLFFWRGLHSAGLRAYFCFYTPGSLLAVLIGSYGMLVSNPGQPLARQNALPIMRSL